METQQPIKMSIFDDPNGGWFVHGFRDEDAARIDRLCAVLERLADVAELMAANTHP